MNPHDLRDRWMLLVPLALAAWLGLDILSTWAVRLPYRYDLEWMEGGVLAHAWRLQHLEGIYVEPSPDFIPMIYPPGYPAVLALLGTVTGLGHGLGRFVSILGTLAACGALVHVGWKRFEAPLLGLLSAGVFLGMYPRSGAFYDLVRPDALFVGLVAWAIVLGLDASARKQKAAGLLLFAAFTVKHNAAMFGFPLALGLLATHGWRAMGRFVLWSAVPGGLFAVGMEILTGGLFTTWILEVPRSHPMVDARVLPGSLREIGSHLPVACVVAMGWILGITPKVAPKLPVPLLTVVPTVVAALCIWTFSAEPQIRGIDNSPWYEASLGYALFGVALAAVPLAVVGMIQARKVDGRWVYALGLGATAWLVTALMRGHHGGFVNVFMFLHWALAAAMLVGFVTLRRVAPARVANTVAAVLALAQLGLLTSQFDGSRLEPSEEDTAAGDALVAALSEMEGPVLSPFNPWVAAQAGHEPGYHLIALWDIRHKEGPFRDDVARVLAGVRDQHYGTVVDAQQTAGLGIAKHYVKTRTINAAPRALMPKTGWRRRPTVIWTRK